MQSNSEPQTLRVLGIDPGYERVGIAVIEKDKRGKEVLLYSDCLRTPKTSPHEARLVSLIRDLENVMEEFKPNVLAIETLFFNENQKTAMPVAEARGAMIVTGAKRKMRVEEYSPLQVKVATTGYGKADKKQIIAMIPRLISISKPKMLDDEYDAIAIALTSLASQKRVG